MNRDTIDYKYRMQKRTLKSAVAIGFGVMFLLTGCGSKSDYSGESSTDHGGNVKTSSSEITTLDESSAIEVQEGISYPYVLNDGKLTVNSIFTSDIDNPDADNENAENLISIELKNTSGEFLESADLTITLDDGTAVPVSITDLPADETVWAFASDNSALDTSSAEIIALGITADMTQYNEETGQIPSNLEINTDGTMITLTNKDTDTMNDIKVYCHTKFDEILYGGVTYTYTVDSLSAGETTTIAADDCMLGEAEVVAADLGMEK